MYGGRRTSTVKLGGRADPRASAPAASPQYSATQPDQKQHRRLRSSHSRKPLCPFHSGAHGPERSDKTTCWRVAPNSMCHGLECFSFCACHRGGWPVATLDWFSEQTEILLQCLSREKMEKEKSLRFTSSNLCDFGGWAALVLLWLITQAQEWWMWTCRPPQTIGCRDERWIVSFAFSHIICEIPDTASYFALFLNSHRSCGTHPLFRWHYLLWEYIEVGTNENTNTGQQAFRTSSLARRNQPGLLSKCWHFEPESNISRNYGFKPSLMVEPMDRNQQSSCRGRLAALRNTEKRRGLMNNISKREGDMAAGN